MKKVNISLPNLLHVFCLLCLFSIIGSVASTAVAVNFMGYEEIILSQGVSGTYIFPTNSKALYVKKLIMEDGAILRIDPRTMFFGETPDTTPYEFTLFAESAQIGFNCKIVVDNEGTTLNANKVLIFLGLDSNVKYCSIYAKGQDGEVGKPGAKGKKGKDASMLESAKNGHPGGKGGTGGPGGNGADVFCYYMPGAKIGKVNCENPGGLGGNGGPGGPGGDGGDGYVITYPFGSYNAHDPGNPGVPGPMGDSGAKGKPGKFTIEMLALSQDNRSITNEEQKKVFRDFGFSI